MQILQDLNDHGLTILLVTHEPEIACYMKRIIRFRDGCLQTDEPVTVRQRAASALAELKRFRAS
jgi:putative ABC transport system ATP-binding protein